MRKEGSGRGRKTRNVLFSVLVLNVKGGNIPKKGDK